MSEDDSSWPSLTRRQALKSTVVAGGVALSGLGAYLYQTTPVAALSDYEYNIDDIAVSGKRGEILTLSLDQQPTGGNNVGFDVAWESFDAVDNTGAHIESGLQLSVQNGDKYNTITEDIVPVKTPESTFDDSNPAPPDMPNPPPDVPPDLPPEASATAENLFVPYPGGGSGPPPVVGTSGEAYLFDRKGSGGYETDFDKTIGDSEDVINALADARLHPVFDLSPGVYPGSVTVTVSTDGGEAVTTVGQTIAISEGDVFDVNVDIKNNTNAVLDETFGLTLEITGKNTSAKIERSETLASTGVGTLAEAETATAVISDINDDDTLAPGTYSMTITSATGESVERELAVGDIDFALSELDIAGQGTDAAVAADNTVDRDISEDVEITVENVGDDPTTFGLTAKIIPIDGETPQATASEGTGTLSVGESERVLFEGLIDTETEDLSLGRYDVVIGVDDTDIPLGKVTIAIGVEDWNDLNDIRNDLAADYVLVTDLDSNTGGYDQHVANKTQIIDDPRSDRFENVADGATRTVSNTPVNNPEVIEARGAEDVTVSVQNSSEGIVEFSMQNGPAQEVAVEYTTPVEVSGWDPVGSVGPDPTGSDVESFTGSFSGAGYTVADLETDRTGLSGTPGVVGLFAVLEDADTAPNWKGNIRDLTLSGVDITGGPGASLVALNGVFPDPQGSGIEVAGGTIENISVTTGTVALGVGDDIAGVGGGVAGLNIDGRIREVSVASSVTANFGGSVVGYNAGEIFRAAATGPVNAERSSRDIRESFCGGIAGANLNVPGVDAATGKIEQSYASGSVYGGIAGGLVGANGLDGASGGTIVDSYATSAVVGLSPPDASGGGFAGGLVGLHFATNGTDATVERCYAAGVLGANSEFSVGGIAGGVGAGENSILNIFDSYWDTDTTGESGAVGEIARNDGIINISARPRSSADMTGATAPTEMDELDFDQLWDVNSTDDGADSDSYPFLATNQQDPVPLPPPVELETLDIANQGADATVIELPDGGITCPSGNCQDIIKVGITNPASDETVENVDIEVGIGDTVLTDSIASISPGETETVSFEDEIQNLGPGEYAALVSASVASEDNVALDTGSLEVQEFPFADGLGTADDPYQVGDWRHLDNIRESDLPLPDKYEDPPQSNIELVSDLDQNTEGYSETFTPIPKFEGVFDGAGKQISDLTLRQSERGAARNALFERNSGEIKETKFDIVEVLSERAEIGAGIVGENNGGTVESCTVNDVSVTAIFDRSSGIRAGVVGANNGGVVRDCTVKKVSLTGIDSSGAGTMAGAVGITDGGTVENCTVEQVVTRETAETGVMGGLVGRCVQGAEITNGVVGANNGGGLQLSTGSIELTELGGAIGSVTGQSRVEGCTATLSTTANELEVIRATSLGGLIGSAEGDVTVQDSDATISTAPARREEVIDSGIGGVIGSATNGVTIQKCYATGQIVTGSDRTSLGAAGGLVGREFEGVLADCYARTSIDIEDSPAGGLIGESFGSQVDKTYAAGTVSATGDPVGGLIGRANETMGGGSYYDTDATGQPDGIGVSRNETVGVTGLGTDEMQGNSAPDNMTAFDFTNTWDVKSANNTDGPSYPFLSDNPQNPAPGVAGTQLPDTDDPTGSSSEPGDSVAPLSESIRQQADDGSVASDSPLFAGFPGDDIVSRPSADSSPGDSSSAQQTDTGVAVSAEPLDKKTTEITVTASVRVSAIDGGNPVQEDQREITESFELTVARVGATVSVVGESEPFGEGT